MIFTLVKVVEGYLMFVVTALSNFKQRITLT